MSISYILVVSLPCGFVDLSNLEYATQLGLSVTSCTGVLNLKLTS